MSETVQRRFFPAAGGTKSHLRPPILRGAFLVLTCIVAYSNSFHVPFLFDDVINILDKPYVRDIRFFFSSETERLFPSDSAFSIRKIGYFTFALNYLVGGDRVVGYHVFNVLVHCINSLLVCWLVALSFRTPVLEKAPLGKSSGSIALFSALLFASHPVQTQAVTYVVQRFTSVATLFYLLSLASYVKSRLMYEESISWRKALPWHVGSFITAVLAMHTKEIAFTLPVTIVLYELMFFKGETKKRILLTFPLLLTMAIIPLYLLGGSLGAGDLLANADAITRVDSPLTRWEYLATELRVAVTYIRLLFFPANQNLDYDYPVFRSFLDGEVILSGALLFLLAGLAVYLARRERDWQQGTTVVSFGIFWFFVTLSVESSVIPIADVIFEHRVYLPSAGFFIALTSSFFLIAERSKKGAVRRAVVVLLAGAVMAFTGLTYARNEVWRSGLTLWNDVVEKSPGKARGHLNLGVELRVNGRVREAIERYEAAIRLKPDYADAYNNLGVAYKDLGRTDEAIVQYRTAVRLQPDLAEAYNNLGVAYWDKGMVSEAIQQYRRAMSLDAGLAQAHTNLGVAYWHLGLAEQAIEQYRIAIFLRPDLADPYNNLGVIYAERGLTDKAIEHFERAVQIMPTRMDFGKNLDKARAAGTGR